MGDRWRRVEELFSDAVDLPAAERALFLAHACGDDAALRAEVESLIDSAGGTGDRLREAMSITAEALVDELAHEPVGQRIGPYRVLEVLGEGGMGTVYLAERDDGQYRRKVALKILQHALASQQIVARFRDERQILASLDHPDIVRLLDGGTTDDGLPYLVMELVEGVSLERFAAHLPVRQRVKLIARVCGPLQYAHQQLVVHRDIKPSNILVGADGVPKLLDFGIAKLLEPSAVGGREARTRTGVALLTPEYASPEQVRGEVISVASDVYALGAVLFHLLVGRAPQGGSDDVVETLVAICERDPPRPSTVCPSDVRKAVAGDLDNIVLRALQKDPARRYPSVAALADDLERYLDGRPVSAREATFGYRAKKFVGRHRGALALGALIVIALSVATVFSILQASRASEAADEAQAQTRALLVEQGRQTLASGHAGRALPYLVEAWQHGEDTAAVRFLVAEARRPFEREIATIADFPKGLSSTAWSPDGASFLLCGQAGRIAAYDGEGRLMRRYDTRADADLGACVFDPSGDRIAGFARDGSLRLWDVASGALLTTVAAYGPMGETYSVWSGLVSGLAYFDGGRRIAGLRHDGPLQIWDAATGKPLAHVPIEGVGSRAGVFSADGERIFISVAGRVEERDGHSGAVTRDITSLLPTRDVGSPSLGSMALCLSSDDQRLFVAHDRSVWIWDVVNAHPIAELGGHTEAVAAIVLSPNERRVLTTTTGGTVRIWDATSGRMLFDLAGHGHSSVTHADFDPSGKRVVTSAGDSAYRIFDAESGRLETVLEATVTPGTAPQAVVIAVSSRFSRDGSRILSHIGAEALLWRASRVPLLADIHIGGDVVGGAVSRDEQRVLAVGPGGVAEIHALDDDGGLLATIDVGTRFLWDASWSVKGDIAIAGDNGFLALCDPRDGPPRVELAGHTSSVNSVRFSPDGKALASGASDGTVRLWDVETGAQRVLEHAPRVTSVQWNHDGTRLASAAGEGGVFVWDVASGRVSTRIVDASVGFLYVGFTPDETGLTIGGRGGQAGVWDIVSGARRLTFEGHTGPVTSLAYSPDGALVATTCTDLSIRIWDARTGLELGARSHPSEILLGTWLADGRRFVTFGGSHFVRIWDMHRQAGTAAESADYLARHVPWRLDSGRVVRASR